MRLNRLKKFSQIMQSINDKVEIKSREYDSRVCLLYELREISGDHLMHKEIIFQQQEDTGSSYQLTIVLSASIQSTLTSLLSIKQKPHFENL